MQELIPRPIAGTASAPRGRRGAAVSAAPRRRSARLSAALLPFALAAPGLGPGAARAQVSVAPVVETAPVPSSGDAADDAAIWLHPSDPNQSRVIGSDKHGGLAVYDLAGAQLQFLPGTDSNNVDVRYRFPLGGARRDIAVASDRIDDTIDVYQLDPVTGLLSDVTAGAGIPAGITLYGLCLYQSALDGSSYAFVTSQSGQVEQWRLRDDGTGQVTGTLARAFSVGSQSEGCVADDEEAALYIGEENVGIWRYGAEPGDGALRTAVDVTGPSGHLVADVEGLAIYYRSDGSGYLLASSQGNSTFAVYLRAAGNAYVGSFQLVAGGGIDAVTGTDGIDVSNAALGGAFAQGLFVAQDTSNPGGNQNFKLARWQDVANAFSPPLAIDTSWNPRGPAAVPALPLWGSALACGLLLAAGARRLARRPRG